MVKEIFCLQSCFIPFFISTHVEYGNPMPGFHFALVNTEHWIQHTLRSALVAE